MSPSHLQAQGTQKFKVQKKHFIDFPGDIFKCWWNNDLFLISRKELIHCTGKCTRFYLSPGPSTAVLISQTFNYKNCLVVNFALHKLFYTRPKKTEKWVNTADFVVWTWNSCGYSKINNGYQTNRRCKLSKMKRKHSVGVLISLFIPVWHSPYNREITSLKLPLNNKYFRTFSAEWHWA